MNNDVKSGLGYIIPFGAIVGFFTALILGEYLISIVIAIAGILVWFLYMVVMESSPPSNLGNLIIFLVSCYQWESSWVLVSLKICGEG